MLRGPSYTEAEDRAILRADRPRKAHIADCAAVLGRSFGSVLRRGQRLRAAGAVHGQFKTGPGGRSVQENAGDASAAR